MVVLTTILFSCYNIIVKTTICEVIFMQTIFDDSLGFVINKVNLRLKAELFRSARAYDVTAEQWGILNFVAASQGVTQAELSDRTLKDKPNINRIVERLMAKGLLEKRPHPIDRRAHRLYLTEAGEALHLRLMPIVSAVLADATAGIAQEELTQMKATLDKIYRNLESRGMNVCE